MDYSAFTDCFKICFPISSSYLSCRFPAGSFLKLTVVMAIKNKPEFCNQLNRLSDKPIYPLKSLTMKIHIFSIFVTESQNVRVWKGPLWVTQSNPPQKQGHLEQAAEDLVQVGLEYLQRRRLHNLPGQPGPVLCHPQREEVLPRVQREFPLLQFVPFAPCPVTGHHWKESGHNSRRNSTDLLNHIILIPLSWVRLRWG